jgi:hypothetical protein
MRKSLLEDIAIFLLEPVFLDHDDVIIMKGIV